MPYLRIETNAAKDRLPANIAKEVGELVAKISGKPLSYCAGAVIPDVAMSFAGDGNELCAQAKFLCIGKLSPEFNKQASRQIGEFVEAKLGVSPARMYIEFAEAQGYQVGFDKSTF